MYMGNTCTIAIIYDFNADNFDHSDLDFIGGLQLYSEPCEREPFNSVKGLTTKDGKSWGADWKTRCGTNWDSYAAIVTEGESPSYEDNFLDLDPHYEDRFGNPLLRLTFDWHPNEQKMWRFIAARAKEIMAAMSPTRIVARMTSSAPTTSTTTSQRTRPVAASWAPTRPLGDEHLRPGLGHARTSSSPAPRSSRRTPAPTRRAPSARSRTGWPMRFASATSTTPASFSEPRIARKFAPPAGDRSPCSQAPTALAPGRSRAETLRCPPCAWPVSRPGIGCSASRSCRRSRTRGRDLFVAHMASTSCSSTWRRRSCSRG